MHAKYLCCADTMPGHDFSCHGASNMAMDAVAVRHAGGHVVGIRGDVFMRLRGGGAGKAAYNKQRLVRTAHACMQDCLCVFVRIYTFLL
jgi:hypothetical protein